ncbi:MAG TPA: alpha/beta fold hydrolase [Opitutaceae bacterium]|nr:alpha/beta fold hydrolase [Opitutaceae bacterium]
MELNFRDLGGEGKPPLVILHGILGSSRNWQSAGRDLAAGNHVLALDLRNHGGSPHAAGAGYEAMMGDVLAWLEARGLGRIALMGHSMGGKVAMLLACRNPERVERLVVVDIAPKDYSGAGRHREFAAMNALDLTRLRSRADAERELEAAEPDWAMRKFLTTNLDRDEAGRWRWTVNLPVLTAALRELEGNPLGAGERYAGPALFILGGRSRYVAPGEHALITAHFPAARIETLAAGHNPHMEDREAFVRAAAAFLGAGRA